MYAIRSYYVVSDRYVYSSIVYQATQGIPEEFVYSINNYAKVPDLVVILDVDTEEALKRMEGREKEIFEKIEFQNKIREKYYEIINSKNSKFTPKYGYILIDTSKKSLEEVHVEIFRITSYNVCYTKLLRKVD